MTRSVIANATMGLLLGAGVMSCCPGRGAPASTPGPAPSATGDATAAQPFGAMVEEVTDRWMQQQPSWGRDVGLHAYDGKVAQYDAAAIDKYGRWLGEVIARLDKVDAAKLSADEQLDLAALRNRATLERFDIQERALHRSNPLYYNELFDVGGYIKFNYAPLEQRAKQLLAHEQAALKQTKHIISNLSPTLSRPIVLTAVKMFRGYASFLRGDVHKVVRGVKGDAFQKAFAATNEALAAEAERVADTLEKEFVPRADETSHVLGRARYLRFVAAQEGTAYTLEQLKKMADADLARNKQAYAELAKTVTPERPKAQELLGAARALVEKSRLFVIEKQLASMPSDDRCSVEESPPYMRWNAAFLNMPGPFDTAKEAFYYITLPDPSWPEKEQEEYIFPWGTLMATTVHEAYPGHFLHGLFMRNAPTKVQKLTDSYSFTEGWAHYTEQLMIEQGFGADDPQNRLGQLSDALLRNCRFVVSIGVHAEGMSLDQAAQRFIDDCFQDKATAREQAVRATFDPGYFAYTLGKLQILQLRAELQREMGSRFELKAFHDALLSHGAPPLALLRARVRSKLLGQR